MLRSCLASPPCQVAQRRPRAVSMRACGFQTCGRTWVCARRRRRQGTATCYPRRRRPVLTAARGDMHAPCAHRSAAGGEPCPRSGDRRALGLARPGALQSRRANRREVSACTPARPWIHPVAACVRALASRAAAYAFACPRASTRAPARACGGACNRAWQPRGADALMRRARPPAVSGVRPQPSRAG